MSVRVRLAPSPTGPLHVGTARTALFNFLFAKGHDGQFLLRLEDTDPVRSKPEYEHEILEGLAWLGLRWEEGPDVGGPHAPYRQSERLATYRAAIERLRGEGRAYEAEGAVLFRASVTEPIVVTDLVRGEVPFPASEFTDFVIARSGPSRAGREELLPTFHLAVVVDDAAMRITHVIRGEDHLSNTPKHILLQRALGLPTPAYAHLPLLFDAQRRKLSKRTAETSLLSYRERGYLPEALVNFLALLGWNPKTTEEVFSLEDLVERFDLSAVQKHGAIFAPAKLDWLQAHHLRRLDELTLAARAAPFVSGRFAASPAPALLRRALVVWRERGGPLHTLPTDLSFCFEEPVLAREDLPAAGTTEAQAVEALRFSAEVVRGLSAEAGQSPGAMQAALVTAVDRAGRDRGMVLWPLRYALTGRRESPGPGEIAWVLGRDETLRRLARARRLLEGR